MTLFLFFTKVIVCSAAFFGYYFFFLRNKQFHQYNRYYLLTGAALSFLLPLVHIPVLLSDQASENVLIKSLSVITVSGWEDEFVVTPDRSVLYLLLTFKNVAVLIYLAGFTILTAQVAKFLLYIKKLSRRYHQEQINGVFFYNTCESGTPFSFFNTVYWNEKILVSTEKGQQILQHELFHIRAKHSYDIIFLKAVTVVFWFNPFCYLFMKEIKAIHEFSADEYASSTADRYDYAELLVTEAISNKKAFLSNQFFHNQIKRRITMLIKQNTSSFSYLRKIMALPLLLFLFCAFTLKTSRHYAADNSSFHSMSDTIPSSEFLKIKPENIKEMNVNNDTIIMKLKNGDNLIMKTKDFMTANNKVIADKIMKDRTVDMKFKNVNGDTVTVEADVSYKANDKVIADTISESNMIFTQTEAEATYPGGKDAWITYLNKTFKYPQEAQDKEIQGTVIVQFMVDKEGNVSDIKALSGPETGGLREETIRIIQNSGKWIPGKQNGLTVRSFRKQPVTYKLERQ